MENFASLARALVAAGGALHVTKLAQKVDSIFYSGVAANLF
jgi:hypothetical protein